MCAIYCPDVQRNHLLELFPFSKQQNPTYENYQTKHNPKLLPECVSRKKSDGKRVANRARNDTQNYFRIAFAARKHLRRMLFLRVNTRPVPNSPERCNFIGKFRIIVTHNTQHNTTLAEEIRLKSDIRMRKFPVEGGLSVTLLHSAPCRYVMLSKFG